MTEYHDPYSCNRCAEETEITITDRIDHHMLECKTKCKVCEFEDYWAHGFLNLHKKLNVSAGHIHFHQNKPDRLMAVFYCLMVDVDTNMNHNVATTYKEDYQMEKLNVRFPSSVNDDIEFISKSGDFDIAKSLVARAAISLGLEQIELARTTMSDEAFVFWLDANQSK